MITQTFPSSEINIERPRNFIKSFYKELGYEVDRVEFIIQCGIPLNNSTCVVVRYTPFLTNGKPARKLSFNEMNDLDLNSYGSHFYLGRDELLPLAIKQAKVLPNRIEQTETGIYLLKPNLRDEDEYKHIMNVLYDLKTKGVVSYKTTSQYDIMLLFEFISIKGGMIMTEPKLTANNEYQVICMPPENYNITTMKNAIRNIKMGKLPLESFIGRWSIFEVGLPVENLYEKIAIVNAIAIVAYKKLAEVHPYLKPLIYDVTMGHAFDIQVPIASMLQKLEYKKLLEETLKEYPIEEWNSVKYYENKDLILKRFYFEKKSPFVFAPLTQSSKYAWYAPKLLIYYGNFSQPTEEELSLVEDEITMLLMERPQLEGVIKGKNRCIANCGLERSVCCVDTVENKRVEPRDLEVYDKLLKLTPQEEERLLKMDFGLRGFFNIGGVLNGLYEEPPLPPSIYDYNRAKRITSATLENKMILYMVQTESDKQIPVLTTNDRKVLQKDLEDQLREKWDSGKLITPWASAMLEAGSRTMNIMPSQCLGGEKCFLIGFH